MSGLLQDVGYVLHLVFEGEYKSECLLVLGLGLGYFEEVLILEIVEGNEGEMSILQFLFWFSSANTGLGF